MLRNSVRLAMAGGVMALTLVVPTGAEAQGTGRVRVQAPPVRSSGNGTAVRRPTAKEVPVRPAPRGDDRRVDRGVRNDRDVRDDRDRRDDRDDRYDRDDRFDRDDREYRYDRDDRYDRDRWDDRRWDRNRGDVGRWQVRSDADLRLFGFLNIDIRWDRRDRDDRGRWLERYRRYDGWGGFGARLDGWYVPRWGAVRFERDPLRYGPRPLDHRELRRILGARTFGRIVRETPGGAAHLWGRVERFGPRGRALTLEIWSGGRYVAALTDFDRDGWVDDVMLNGRFVR